MAAGVRSLCGQIEQLCKQNPSLCPTAQGLLRVILNALAELGHGKVIGKPSKPLAPPTRHRKQPEPRDPPPLSNMEVLLARKSRLQKELISLKRDFSQHHQERELMNEISQLEAGLAARRSGDSSEETVYMLPGMGKPTLPPLRSSGGTDKDTASGTRASAECYISGGAPPQPVKPHLPNPKPSSPPPIQGPPHTALQQPFHHHHHHAVQLAHPPEQTKPKEPSHERGFMSHIRELKGGPTEAELVEKDRRQKMWLESLELQIKEKQARKDAERRQIEEEERIADQRLMAQQQKRNGEYQYDHRHIFTT